MGVNKKKKQKSFPFHWITSSMPYLGISLTSPSSKLFQTNYIPLLASCKQEMDRPDKFYRTWPAEPQPLKCNCFHNYCICIKLYLSMHQIPSLQIRNIPLALMYGNLKDQAPLTIHSLDTKRWVEWDSLLWNIKPTKTLVHSIWQQTVEWHRIIF